MMANDGLLSHNTELMCHPSLTKRIVGNTLSEFSDSPLAHRLRMALTYIRHTPKIWEVTSSSSCLAMSRRLIF